MTDRQGMFSPTMINAELVDHCNLRCSLCANRTRKQTKRQMTLETVKKIVNLYPENIYWYDWGDPLLHKQFVEVADAVGNNSFVSSNFAMKISEDVLRALNKFTVIASISGLTQDVYEIYNRGGDVGSVLNNLRRFAAIKTTRAILRWQEHPYNAHQKKKAISLAKELGFEFEPISLVVATVEDQLMELTSPLRTPRESTLRQCKSLQDIVIDVDGEYLICCHTTKKRLDLHLDDEPTRDQILKKRLEHPFCRQCNKKMLWREYF